jgi:hypothetical protein
VISDRNVRVAADTAAVRGGQARCSGLARLLLNLRLALLFLAAPLPPMFACVIPVAPDFQDPLAAVNAPPAFVSASPEFGMVVSGAPIFDFRTQVVDPNANDTLYARWVLDYPPLTAATFTHNDDPPYYPTGTGSVHFATPNYKLDCSSGFGTVTTPQRLAVYVADRPLQPNTAENSNRLDLTEPGGYVTSGSWTVVFQCPPLSTGTP